MYATSSAFWHKICCRCWYIWNNQVKSSIQGFYHRITTKPSMSATPPFRFRYLLLQKVPAFSSLAFCILIRIFYFSNRKPFSSSLSITTSLQFALIKFFGHVLLSNRQHFQQNTFPSFSMFLQQVSKFSLISISYLSQSIYEVCFSHYYPLTRTN